LPKRQGQRNQNAFSALAFAGAPMPGSCKTVQTRGSGVADSLLEGENNNSFRRI